MLLVAFDTEAVDSLVSGNGNYKTKAGINSSPSIQILDREMDWISLFLLGENRGSGDHDNVSKFQVHLPILFCVFHGSQMALEEKYVYVYGNSTISS